MVDSFAPSIIIYGKTVHPKGYEWILGFALHGCKWAIDIASTEKFRKSMREDLEKISVEKTNNLIKQYEKKIAELKATK